MTKQSIADIAHALGAEFAGDGAITVTAVREPQNAGPNDLALAMEPSYADALQAGHAQAAVVWQDADWQALGLKAAIFAPRSRYVLSGVSHVFEHTPDIFDGVHPSAIVDPTATRQIRSHFHLSASARLQVHLPRLEQGRLVPVHNGFVALPSTDLDSGCSG